MTSGSMVLLTKFFQGNMHTMTNIDPHTATWADLHASMPPDEFLAVLLACLVHEGGGALEMPDRSLRDFLGSMQVQDNCFGVTLETPPTGCGITVSALAA